MSALVIVDPTSHTASTIGEEPEYAYTDTRGYVRSILRNPRFTVGDRLVAHVLAGYANRDGVAWPASETLADDCGMNPASVRRALARLVAAGVVAVTRRPGHSNVYRFPVRHPATTPRVIPTPRRTARGDLSPPRADGRGTPRRRARTPRADGRAISSNEVLRKTRAPVPCADSPPPTTNGKKFLRPGVVDPEREVDAAIAALIDGTEPFPVPDDIYRRIGKHLGPNAVPRSQWPPVAS